jgi:ankyrin repeat protein
MSRFFPKIFLLVLLMIPNVHAGFFSDVFNNSSSSDTDSPQAKAMYTAVHDNNQAKVLELLNSGVDVNALDAYGDLPLGLSAVYGYKELAEFLLSKGAKINKKDKDSRTALDMVVRNPEWNQRGNRYEIIKLLLDKGANANSNNGHGSLVESAAYVQDMEALKLLVEYGGSVNVCDDFQGTPLHYAVNLEHPKVIRFLVAHGADLKATNKDGKTPADRAKAKGNSELAAFLTNPNEHQDYLFNLDGLDKYKSGDYAGAVVDFTHAIGVNPQCFDYLINRAKANLALKHYSELLIDGNEMVKLNPKWHDGYMIRAEALTHTGEYAKAKADLNKAMDCLLVGESGRTYVPKDVLSEVSNRRSVMLYEIEEMEKPQAFAAALGVLDKISIQDFKGALDAVTAAIKLNPEFADHYVQSAIYQYKLGNQSGAELALKQAIKLDPYASGAYAWLGIVYMKSGDKNLALTNFNTAKRYNPGDPNANAELSKIDAAEWADIQRRAAIDNEYTRKQRIAEEARDQIERKKIEAENERIRKANSELESSNTGGYWQMNADASKRDLENMQKADALRRNADYRRQNNCSAGDTRAECR